jgi:hypothetical protein
LNWKNHIDQLVPKLSGAYYAVRSMLHVSDTDTLKSIYFAHFHAFKFGIIFVCNSSDSKTLPCEYIFSLINFITHNKEHFQTNAEVQSVNTTHKHYLLKPTPNFSCFQTNAYYAGIKRFNDLPSDLKHLMNEKAPLSAGLLKWW